MKIFWILESLWSDTSVILQVFVSEKASLSVKQIKDKQWSWLMDWNLKNLVVLASVKLQPSDMLAGVKQRQNSKKSQ
jgi:hypothetical protein